MRGAALGGAVCAASAALAYAVRGRSSTVFAPSVYRGPRDRPAVALTFDDGPSEGTGYLLDNLNRLNIPATFFMCGANVRRLPAVARETASAGHEIGNHSYSHPAFYFRSQDFIYKEVSDAQSVIADTTRTVPSLFRAPYGARWFGLREAQRQFGLLGVMWTVIGLDWKLPADRIVNRVLARAGNGSIICLHDGRGIERNPDIGETLDAVARIVPALLDRGFRFETVTQLLCPTN